MNLLDNLKGKVISVTIIDDDINHDFIDPELVDVFGKMFITGTTPKGHAIDSGWTDNCPGGVALDRVTNYVIFDSVESYEYSIKRSHQLDD